MVIGPILKTYSHIFVKELQIGLVLFIVANSFGFGVVLKNIEISPLKMHWTLLILCVICVTLSKTRIVLIQVDPLSKMLFHYAWFAFVCNYLSSVEHHFVFYLPIQKRVKNHSWHFEILDLLEGFAFLPDFELCGNCAKNSCFGIHEDLEFKVF